MIKQHATTPLSIEEIPTIDLKGYSVEELAQFANVSVDIIKSAIKLRQQQMMKEKRQMKRTTTRPPVEKSLSFFGDKITSFPQTKISKSGIHVKKDHKACCFIISE